MYRTIKYLHQIRFILAMALVTLPAKIATDVTKEVARILEDILSPRVRKPSVIARVQRSTRNKVKASKNKSKAYKRIK